MDNKPTFNLIDQPWIPVHDLDGTAREVSLHDFFAHAHELRDIDAETPTLNFALLRLVLAVLYSALAPEKPARPVHELTELWNQDELPLEDIAEYLEEYKSRFDLLDPVTPFFQVPDLHTSKGEWKSLSTLVPFIEDGDRPLFAERRDVTSLEFAEAARWLVHLNAFDVSGIKSGAVGDPRVKGGKGYPIGTGWCGWFGGHYAVGSTVKETLLLNLVLDRDFPDDDLPIWEREHLTSAPRVGAVAARAQGPVELLTWPIRRVRINHDGERVTDGLICNGDQLDHTAHHGLELMCSWRFSKPQSQKFKRPVYMPLEFDSSKAAWRGLQSILPKGSSLVDDTKKYGPLPQYYASGISTWLGTLVHAGLIAPQQLLTLRIVGIEYGAQSSSYTHIGADALVFPAALVGESGSQLLPVALAGVERADAAIQALVGLARTIQKAASGTGDSEIEDIRSDAFHSLDALFRAWLTTLNSASDAEARLSEWTETVRRIIRDKGRAVIDAAPDKAWRGKEISGHFVTVGTADYWFSYFLDKALHRPPKDGDTNLYGHDHNRKDSSVTQTHSPQQRSSATDALSRFVAARVLTLQEQYLRDQPNARAALAQLRRGLTQDGIYSADLWGIVFDGMPDELVGRGDEPNYAERAIFAALCFYATHQQGKPDGVHDTTEGKFSNFGDSMRMLASPARDDSREGAVTRRFQAVITADTFEELTHHMRGLIKQMRAKNVSVNYVQLARDLYYFQFDAYRSAVRLRWARQYYSVSTAASPADTTESSSATV